jgi:TatD DNase family protein
MVELTDTHCHIHEAAFESSGDSPVHKRWLDAGKKDPGDMIEEASRIGVTRLLCVGTTLADSKLAIDVAGRHLSCWASIGMHPHEAKTHLEQRGALDSFASLATQPNVVAVGECGLDYFYEHSPKEQQAELLKFQIELALTHNLPLIFHVREAFEDFWPIFDSYQGIRGVIHSFSASTKELDEILKRNLFVGLNGIMTFTKNPAQLEAAKAVPLSKLVLETDAPFLTPTPYRGTINQPKFVRVTAEFLAHLRGESLEQIAAATTQNSQQLFDLKPRNQL